MKKTLITLVALLVLSVSYLIFKYEIISAIGNYKCGREYGGFRWDETLDIPHSFECISWQETLRSVSVIQ